MNSRLWSPEWMISRATVFARAMSVPTSMPSQPSAHWAETVRRGSTTNRRAPLCTAFRTWWKKIGCVSRAFDPHRMMRSVSSTSRYELVPPPAPNTVARPTTLGACQVRLQLSMLLVPTATRANFCATKLTSFEAFEHEKIPSAFGPPAATAELMPAAARSSASSHVAGRSTPLSRTIGSVSRVRVFAIPITSLPNVYPDRSPTDRRGAMAERPYSRGRECSQPAPPRADDDRAAPAVAHPLVGGGRPHEDRPHDRR